MILRGFKRSTPPRRSGSSGCSGSRHRFATPPRPRSSLDSIGTRGSRNTSRNSLKDRMTCSACAARSARSPPSPLEIEAFRYRVALGVEAASVQMKQVKGPRDMSGKQVMGPRPPGQGTSVAYAQRLTAGLEGLFATRGEPQGCQRLRRTSLTARPRARGLSAQRKARGALPHHSLPQTPEQKKPSDLSARPKAALSSRTQGKGSLTGCPAASE